ncbi:efflux RND transporter permease subunit [Halonatronum saccharophilum]|uniref:efflux RND transporter permease subunit n=1 Tax=Halonatronum saccharophilum TaxID=150060 RepID=UPI0004B79637|nr:MMPL family transporter [Halonatronum saccharophilum]
MNLNMKFINNIVTKYPKLVVGITILVTIFFAYYASQVEINTDIKDMFPEDHPTINTFEDVGDAYGGSEFVVLILEHEEHVLNIETLERIDYLTNQFEDLQGVNKVRSITNIDEIRGMDFTIEVGEFIDELPQSQSEINLLREEILDKDRYIDTLVSDDFKAATVVVQLETDADQEKIVVQIEEIVDGLNLEEATYLTGSPVLSKRMTDNMRRDIGRLFPFVVFVVLAILYGCFKSKRGVFMPLMIVIFSVIWTMGLISITGNTLSLVSTALPVLLVSVGSAYSIHFLLRFYEDLNEGLDKKAAVSSSIKMVGIPIIMAGITTMIGFSSLVFSDLTILQEVGAFAAFGVFSALLISITFMPAMLLLMKETKHLKAVEGRPLIDKFLEGINNFVQSHYKGILVFSIVIVILSLIVVPKIEPETNYIAFFEDGSEMVMADDLVNDKFGGASTLDIVIDTGVVDGIEEVEFLRKVENLQEDLEKNEMLSNSLSVVDLLKEANQALNEGLEEFNVLPEFGIAQYLLLLSSGESNILEDVIDFDHQEAKVSVMVAEADSSQKVAEVVAYAEELIDEYFEDYDVILTGVPVLNHELTGMVITSQIRSLIASVFFAFLVTSILLKSPIKGLACSLPVALTVILNFGLMGWTDVTLNVATSMIASVAVGIGVDYSIHFYTRYLEEREDGLSMEEALKKAIFNIGRANYFNAIAVIAGFLVLLFSSIPPLRSFGLLTSITMIASFFGAMIFLPATILFKEKVLNKKDKSLAN